MNPGVPLHILPLSLIPHDLLAVKRAIAAIGIVDRQTPELPILAEMAPLIASPGIIW